MRLFTTSVFCIVYIVSWSQNTTQTGATDSLTIKYLDEVTLYASRIPEKILQSPVSVE